MAATGTTPFTPKSTLELSKRIRNFEKENRALHKSSVALVRTLCPLQLLHTGLIAIAGIKSGNGFYPPIRCARSVKGMDAYAPRRKSITSIRFTKAVRLGIWKTCNRFAGVAIPTKHRRKWKIVLLASVRTAIISRVISSVRTVAIKS